MSRTLKVVLAIFVSAGQVNAVAPRPITVEDCVRTRRIVEGEVRLSPDGSRVAYVVKAPNIATNRNDFELYVCDLDHLDTRENGRMMLKADGISGIRWTGPGQLMALITNESQDKVRENLIASVDSVTGAVETLDLPGKIKDYSVSADGATVVFSVATPLEQTPAAAEEQKVRDERGYPIVFGGNRTASVEDLGQYEVFLAKKTASGEFETKKLGFTESAAAGEGFRLRDVSNLNLSPDGKYLLFIYSSTSLPASWAGQPYFELIKSWGTGFHTHVLGLYDFSTSQLRVGFNFPGAFLDTEWSRDSQSYSVVGPAPFGTDDARREVATAQTVGDLDEGMARFLDVFAVDPKTGIAQKIIGREHDQAKILTPDLPLVWEHSDGAVLVRADTDHLAWMERKEAEWREKSQLSLPNDLPFASSLQSNGKILVGVHQTTMTPPDLFILDLGTGKWRTLTDLNPEYREIELGEVQPIFWTNRYGSKCTGFLIKPVGYQRGKRYPMIFLSAPPADVFISDAFYTTSYAPQPLAQAGFVVLVSQYPRDNRVPRGRFRGQMSDAYNWMAMVESSVDLLVRRGMVDPQNVGLAGFSRTSWLTDFTLTHSSYRFTAASSADSGIYLYGTYFRYNSRAMMESIDVQVGGPPYGRTLRYWLEYAPPFNAEKVKTAVLMEYRGGDEHGLEFFTALSRLGKAVELYRYPKGAHPFDTPSERVASLQRNVDWFRFWMQGQEGKSPDYDPGQYDRWRALKSRVSAGHSFTWDPTH